MNGPVLDPDKEESTMEALGMIETRGLVALIEPRFRSQFRNKLLHTEHQEA